MASFSFSYLHLISIIILIYILVKYVFNEKQIHLIKYMLYVVYVMSSSIVLMPLFLLRPLHASNIRLAALFLNPVMSLFGIKYRIENAQVLDKVGPCVIVANHQSSIDFIGMMQLWPKHVRYCTILAKKELFWAFPFGFTAWLAGLEYVDRKNRKQATETMGPLTRKVQNESLRLWVFPEGTRNMNETFLPFKTGAFRLAIEAQVPIVPVVFSSYKSIYNADTATNSFYWRRGYVTIRCLEPIDTKGMTIENDLKTLIGNTEKVMINAYKRIRTTPNDKKEN